MSSKDVLDIIIVLLAATAAGIGLVKGANSWSKQGPAYHPEGRRAFTETIRLHLGGNQDECKKISKI